MPLKIKSKTAVTILSFTASCFALGQSLDQESPYANSGSVKYLAQSYSTLLGHSVNLQSGHKTSSSANENVRPGLHQLTIRDEKLLGGPSDDLLSTSDLSVDYPMTPVELAASVNPLLGSVSNDPVDTANVDENKRLFHSPASKHKLAEPQSQTHLPFNQGFDKSPW